MSTFARIAVRVLAVLAGLVLVVPTPAVAAPGEPTSPLGLSMSGEGPWTTSLTTPLFDPDMRWVPGDTVTSGFWAANRSSDSTEFRISLLPWEQSLMNSGEFELRVRSGDDRWEPVRSVWTAPRPLAPGEKMHIQLRATLPATASNATQTLAFGFDIRTRLTYQAPVVAPTPRPTPRPTATPVPPSSGAGAAEGSRPADDDGVRSAAEDRPAAPSHGALAGTGADQPAWLLPLGAGALITGLWMALVARHRREEESDV